MKRRAISFFTVLALCLSLCPIRAMAENITKYTVTKDSTFDVTYVVQKALRFEANGNIYTVTTDPAIRVESIGSLYLQNSADKTGTVQSTNGAGIEVRSGGLLNVNDSDVTVIGTTYGLDIAAGAEVELSGGTFKGTQGAIHLQENGADYRNLLASTDDTHYAYFDENGNPIPLTDVAGEKTVTVKQCTDHSYRYTPDAYTPGTGSLITHSGICEYCGAPAEPEKCTFNLDKSNPAECVCGHTITITITQPSDDLPYNGKPRPDNVSVTVMLDENKELHGATITEETDCDYTVKWTPGTSAGQTFTITVTGKTYDGIPYTKTFGITQATPKITWADNSKIVDYDGDPVDDLPTVAITAETNADKAELEVLLYYSYKKDGDTDFTEGLPTDAGTYQIVASLPATQNYTAASSDPITLTISKINPIKDNGEPKAKNLTYDGTAQELVTPGTVWDGAVVKFATSEDGTYSETIPTGINAGTYTVWYKVDETTNYTGVGPTEITGVKIQRKQITPDVELEYSSYVYTGGEIQPKVTVKDGDTVLPTSEYTVTYSNNVNVGGPKPETENQSETEIGNEAENKVPTVTVTDTGGGNYAFDEVKTPFTITPQDQAGLNITGQPNIVTYGDQFTLGTSGGSGNGTVTWKITYGDEYAEIDKNSGKVTVKGVGTVTVQATKSDTDNDGNHKDATATWTFTSVQKHVTATVTADNKTYDGTNTATVKAKVAAQDIVSGDKIEIDATTLTGTFSTSDAGTNKIVTVTWTGAFSGTGSEKYTVTIPETTTADIYKAVTEIPTAPDAATPTYDGNPHNLITAADAAPTTTVTNGEAVVVEYALGSSGFYSKDIPQATDAGSYEVWYRVRETNNYFGTVAEKVVVTISPKTVSNPDITLELPSAGYVYDGTEKKPAVTVKDGETVIPSSEYTVTYSNNVNVGDATVTVTDKAGGNYNVSGSVTFSILIGQATLTVTPQAIAGLTYNGQEQNLVSAGVVTGGSLMYALKDDNTEPAANDYKPEIPKKIPAGEYKVYYKVVGDDNHADIDPAYVFVTIQPKTVISPVITLANDSVPYTGEKQEPGVTSVKDGGVEIPTGEYIVTYSNNINAGTATVHINDANGGNYIVNGNTTFEITKAVAEFTKTPTAAKQPDGTALTYSGKAQTLIKAGVADGGTAVYALDDQNGPYFETLPTGIDATDYTVYAKVLGDENHVNSPPIEITGVKISPKSVAPKVTCSPAVFPYDGTEKTPNIIVTYTEGGVENVVPASEYTVMFDNQQRTAVGTYNVTVTAKTNGNYTFTTDNKGTFEIKPADQAPLSIVTDMAPTVYYGDTFRLSAVGGSGTGAIQWSIESTPAGVATITDNGVVTVNGVGGFTVTAYREGVSDSYKESNKDSITFTAKAKPVTAVVTAKDKVYNGDANADLTVTVPNTNITIEIQDNYKGTFNSADVGTNKTVTLNNISDNVVVTGGNNYEIAYPATTTASITPAPTSLDGITVTAQADLMYNGIPQELINKVTLSDDDAAKLGGDLAYSLDGRNYDLNIPTGLNAGTYTVRYKVLGDKNHTDSEVKTVTVTIEKATPTIDSTNLTATPITSEQTLKDSVLSGGRAIFDGVEVPGTFTWTNGDTKLNAGTQPQEVTFTPADRVNFTIATTTVEVTVGEESESSDGGDTSGSGTDTPPSSPPTNPDTETSSTQTTVRGGVANTVVSAMAGNQLANEAVANQSENVVIKQEITGDVTKAEVSLPASAVSRIGNETNASLTVSTPVADVTIPNGALNALSSAGGTVSVAAEQVDNTVVLTLTANGKDVGDLPGGLTLTVPTEDAGPGTVAVLVYADGTRVTIRKSVAGDDGVRIPLNGSATVEIVDNSKEFADVPAENWAADAVAFASAHEMFNGTSETTFSPEISMSRAMLATVLYNLESNPDTAFNGTFADVGGDAWYAESVSWAAESGIVTGYGDGSFGANDSVTREQLAVMLWRYAGSPTAGNQTLAFTDAAQASSYAAEALCWAVENGILNGYGNGRIDPTGQATRAQAAQMLKNFIENS